MCMSYEAFGEEKWGAEWGRDECNDEGLEGRVIICRVRGEVHDHDFGKFCE